jgi:hypothetical protein
MNVASAAAREVVEIFIETHSNADRHSLCLAILEIDRER